MPAGPWRGRSGLNAYGDFVMQTDGSMGQLLAALDRAGLAANTLVIFTSDNGCSPAAGVAELERKGHFPSYHFRGYKADIFDGGHRIPFLARWPGRIAPGTASDQLICLCDLMATCAEIVGVKLPAAAGEDSVSLLPVLLATARRPIREAVVHHSVNGSFAIRQGRWKLELCPDSGGWSDPKPGSAAAQKLPPIQLYDMTAERRRARQPARGPSGGRDPLDQAAGEVRGRRPQHARSLAAQRHGSKPVEGQAAHQRRSGQRGHPRLRTVCSS